MNSYVDQLKLNFDPFDVAASSGEFFEGGNRRVVLDRIVEKAMYSESVISVTGSLGSGKTSLAKAISKKFSDEAVIVNVLATLFMNSSQFLDELATSLALPAESESDEDRAAAVVDLAGRLQANGSSLLIQIDDAQEMSAEVLKELVALKTESPSESLRIILFGESQLANTLENTLEPDELAILAEFELEGFGSEATIDYVRFKLACAGYSKPLPLSGNELGAIHNASQGMPGVINALVRNELGKQVEPEPIAADEKLEEVEALEALEDQFSTDVALDETDYTEAELEEFSAAIDIEGANEPRSDEPSNANRYFIAAGVLLVVLVGAIVLLRPANTTQTATAQIEVATSSAGSSSSDSLSAIAERTRIVSETAAPSIANPSTNSVGTNTDSPTLVEPEPRVAEEESELLAQAKLEELPIGSMLEDTPNSISSEVAEAGTEARTKATMKATAGAEESTVEPDTEIAPALQTPTANNVAVQEPELEILPAESSPIGSGRQQLSAFEQGLLAEPSTNFTVQLVGALSETNIAAFVAANPDVTGSGYFETQLNGKPWYVVVAGSFPSRESAAAWLENLPASIKSSGPWVRELAGIQSDLKAR